MPRFSNVRRLKFHQQRGQTFRCWKPVKLADATAESNADGLFFEEVELPDTARALFSESTDEAIQKEFGLIATGAVKLSVMHQFVEITKDTMILQTDSGQERESQVTFTRGTGETDTLPQRFVTAILKVLVGGEEFDAVDVEAVTADSPTEEGLIRWLDNAPDAGSSITVIFKHQPLYSCLWESYRGSPTGTDGERLPQRVLLKKERE